MSEVLCLVFQVVCVCVCVCVLCTCLYRASFTRGVVQDPEGVCVCICSCVSEEDCGVLCLMVCMNVKCVYVCVCRNCMTCCMNRAPFLFFF